VKLCIQHFYPLGSAPPRWEICFKKCDWDPHPKPYILMIRVTRQFELALNTSVIMLPNKNYVDRPKTKSAIALTKIILKICTFSIKNHDLTRKQQ
jgi:hypothetical protein